MSLADIEDKAAADLRRHVTPIYTARRDDEPGLVGTATLLRVADAFFIVTAAHVIDEAGKGGFCVGEQLTEIQDRFTVTRSPTSNREDDRIDIAFLRVERARADTIGEFLSVADAVDVDDQVHRENRYMALGFPYTANKTSKHGRTLLRRRALPYADRSLGTRAYAEEGLSPQTHLLISFDRKRVAHRDERVGLAPDPHGMSGGIAARIVPSRKVVGIIIEQGRRTKALVATRIGVVIEAIRHRYPELSGAIPSAQCFKPNITSDDDQQRGR